MFKVENFREAGQVSKVLSFSERQGRCQQSSLFRDVEQVSKIKIFNLIQVLIVFI